MIALQFLGIWRFFIKTSNMISSNRSLMIYFEHMSRDPIALIIEMHIWEENMNEIIHDIKTIFLNFSLYNSRYLPSLVVAAVNAARFSVWHHIFIFEDNKYLFTFNNFIWYRHNRKLHHSQPISMLIVHSGWLCDAHISPTASRSCCYRESQDTRCFKRNSALELQDWLAVQKQFPLNIWCYRYHVYWADVGWYGKIGKSCQMYCRLFCGAPFFLYLMLLLKFLHSKDMILNLFVCMIQGYGYHNDHNRTEGFHKQALSSCFVHRTVVITCFPHRCVV